MRKRIGKNFMFSQQENDRLAIMAKVNDVSEAELVRQLINQEWDSGEYKERLAVPEFEQDQEPES
jgi:hypothetical protein